MTDRAPDSLHVYLGYRESDAALALLQETLGFELGLHYRGEDGVLQHSELTRGDAVVVVFTDIDGYDRPDPKGDTVGHGIYVAVARESEVDEVYRDAIDAGCTGVWDPERTEWNYRCRFRDAEGYEWTFGTHRPGAPGD